MILNIRIILQVSVTLSSALGNGTPSGQWLVSFLIDKVISNLTVWSSDQSIADSSVELLSSIAKNSSAAVVAMDNNLLWSMMCSFVTNQAPLSQLPCAVQRKLMCNLILLATGSKKELFLTQVNYIDQYARCDNINLCSHDDLCDHKSKNLTKQLLNRHVKE